LFGGISIRFWYPMVGVRPTPSLFDSGIPWSSSPSTITNVQQLRLLPVPGGEDLKKLNLASLRTQYEKGHRSIQLAGQRVPLQSGRLWGELNRAREIRGKLQEVLAYLNGFLEDDDGTDDPMARIMEDAEASLQTLADRARASLLAFSWQAVLRSMASQATVHDLLSIIGE
jgi:hypothetical protein